MNAQSAGRHTVAVFRQSWIDKVIDALSDYHAILMSIGDGHSSPDDHRKLTALWTRLELLLNPDESDAVSLLKLADAARQSETAAERDSNARDMVQLARNLLKMEWLTIQIELQYRNPAPGCLQPHGRRPILGRCQSLRHYPFDLRYDEQRSNST